MKSKRQKELRVLSCVEESLLHYEKRLSLIQIGGDNAIKFFEINKSGVFGRGKSCN